LSYAAICKIGGIGCAVCLLLAPSLLSLRKSFNEEAFTPTVCGRINGELVSSEGKTARILTEKAKRKIRPN